MEGEREGEGESEGEREEKEGRVWTNASGFPVCFFQTIQLVTTNSGVFVFIFLPVVLLFNFRQCGLSFVTFGLTFIWTDVTVFLSFLSIQAFRFVRIPPACLARFGEPPSRSGAEGVSDAGSRIVRQQGAGSEIDFSQEPHI